MYSLPYSLAALQFGEYVVLDNL